MQIRDNQYYRKTHSTFEGFCKEKWDISRPRAYQLIKAAEVQDNLSTMVDIPKSERSIRPLTSLPPEQQREAYQKAVETAPEGKVTAKHIESIKEFSSSQAYLYRQLEAAQTERNICATAQNIPERQLRPLTKLRDNPEAQKEAWEKAVDTAPEKYQKMCKILHK